TAPAELTKIDRSTSGIQPTAIRILFIAPLRDYAAVPSVPLHHGHPMAAPQAPSSPKFGIQLLRGGLRLLPVGLVLVLVFLILGVLGVVVLLILGVLILIRGLVLRVHRVRLELVALGGRGPAVIEPPDQQVEADEGQRDQNQCAEEDRPREQDAEAGPGP